MRACVSKVALPALASGLCALTLAVAPAQANATSAERCYDLSRLAVGTAWPVAPQTAVPIDIGTLRVHPLVLDGIVQTPKVARLVVADDRIAGGLSPELSAVAVALQIEPAPGVRRIRLRYAEQPGAGDLRAAMVEVNGVRHEWRGSFERLHRKNGGHPGLPARFRVTPEGPVDGNGWQRGQLELELKQPGEIRSFTLGAGFLRLDDLCFRAADATN
jgi:hypothetical protein